MPYALSLEPKQRVKQKKPLSGLLFNIPAILKLALSKNFVYQWLCKAHALANPKGEGNYPNDRETSRDAVILVQIKNC
jgi:hypothetical protein